MEHLLKVKITSETMAVATPAILDTQSGSLFIKPLMLVMHNLRSARMFKVRNILNIIKLSCTFSSVVQFKQQHCAEEG